MIGRDRYLRLQRPQAYCVRPTKLPTEEVVPGHSEKYSIITLSDNHSKGPIDNDGNSHAIKNTIEESSKAHSYNARGPPSHM